MRIRPEFLCYMGREELLSYRKFADKMGTSESNVRKAITSGKIKESSIDRSNPKRPKIHFKSGKADWAKHFTPEKIQNQTLADNLKPDKAKDKPKDQVKETEAGELVINNHIDYQEGMRVEKLFKAKTAQLEYNEQRGQLVDKDSVFKEWYAIGQSLRSSLQGMADKITDHIMAECAAPPELRPKVHAIIYGEVTESLEVLSMEPQLK